MQVIVSDLLINYQVKDSDQKLKILFLHGWADSIKGQQDFIHNLAKLGTVYALDLPGFGESQIPPRAYTLLDYAKLVHEFCEKIDLKNIDVIIGHSNGGAIAIKGIAIGELKTRQLVLIGASGIRNAYKSKASMLKLLTKTGKIATSPLPKNVKTKLRNKLYKSVGSDMLIAEHMEETFKNIVGEDLKNDSKNLNLPTLLIYGEQDTMTPPKYGLQYHEVIDGSTIEIVGQAGHFVQRDQPEITINLIRSFLK